MDLYMKQVTCTDPEHVGDYHRNKAARGMMCWHLQEYEDKGEHNRSKLRDQVYRD